MYGRGTFTSEGRVASHALDQGAKDCTNTNTSTSEANSGKTSTLHLGSSDHGSSRCFSNNASGLHGTTGDAGAQVTAGAVEKQTMADGGLTSLTDDGTLDASWSWSRMEWLDGATRHVVAWIGFWMELTLRSRHETARLNGTATGDGTAEFGCREHYAGLRMKEVVIVVDLRWMEGRGVQNGQQLMGWLVLGRRKQKQKQQSLHTLASWGRFGRQELPSTFGARIRR